MPRKEGFFPGNQAAGTISHQLTRPIKPGFTDRVGLWGGL
jgi:hypothetical protein